MATTTTNFGWDIPQSTDLVKDGATAIAALGQDIDTALVDLKGGTTGQVLAKASNTDLDYSWVAVDPLTILDAKGDLITATAADTPARLAVGTNGQVLTADSTAATGLKWAAASAGAFTLITSTTISSATAKSVDSCFSATYANYLIKFVMTSATSNNPEMTMRLRASSTDATANYLCKRLTAGTGNAVDSANVYTNQWFLGVGSNVSVCAVSVNVENPFASAGTHFDAISANPNQGGQRIDVVGGVHTASTSFDGFTLGFSENVSGTIRVYGYQNS